MKSQVPALIAITGLVILLIIMIVKDNNVTYVYCGDNNSTKPIEICTKKPIPTSLIGENSANQVMHYYKIDDNCNFQTLQFDASWEEPYANLGRFDGEYLPDGSYQINRLEVKSYNFKGKSKKTKSF